MNVVYIIIFFLAGLVFGSFYNVVGFRLSKEESIIKPPSHCPKCKTKLKPLELIPVLSYVFLKGKCSSCKEKISVFYPLMELFTGILFAVSFYSFGFSYELLLAITVSSLFVIVVITDLNYYIIPDQINLFFAVFILFINVLIHGFAGALIQTFYGLTLFLFMYFLMLIGNKILKAESLGGGDIKLCFALGMILPFAFKISDISIFNIISPLFINFIGVALGSFIALPVSMFLYIKNKDKRVPFGPFLIAGFLILLFLKIDINDIMNFLIIK